VTPSSFVRSIFGLICLDENEVLWLEKEIDRHSLHFRGCILFTMLALLAEYAVFHSPELAPEGNAMLSAITESFLRSGYEVITPESGDFEAELRRLAPLADVGLVIAPDHLLGKYSKILEDNCHSIGCGSLNVALCSNKPHVGAILTAQGIAVPKEITTGIRVIKEKRGAGALNMRIADVEPGPEEFGQEFIEGEHMSVSLVISRYVGDACSYYSGRPPLVLSLNRQFIRFDDGKVIFEGGEVNVDHPRKDEIVATAVKAATVLGCQGYAGVDVIVGDKVYVVDVNPRPTSSLTGIVAVMEEEIAEILVRASKGDVPESVHLRGKARYDKNGTVTVL
jgi:predicted ATP-grasp superfamily ATP-dependent carboligase